MDAVTALDLAGCLRALPRADLEALLVRRPEAAELTGAEQPSFRALAVVLASPSAVGSAVAGLDRFHRQVLELACLAGGVLAPAEAEAEGLDRDLFAGAVRELSRWGLGFPRAGGLAVLPACCQRASNLGRLGPPAASMVGALTADELRAIAAGLAPDALRSSRPLRKAELAEAVVAALRRPATVRELVGQAPPLSALVLAALRSGEPARGPGRSSVGWLDEEVPDSEGQFGAWRWSQARTVDGLPWLLGHGLVYVSDARADELAVPAEVERALRGPIFSAWQPHLPDLELVPLAGGRHPAEVVTSLDGALLRWADQPPALTLQGMVNRQDVRRTATALRIDQAEVDGLVTLAVWSGLLAEREVSPERRTRSRRRSGRVLEARRAVMAPTPEATGWGRLPPPRRWLRLVRRWYAAEAWHPQPGGAAATATPVGRVITLLLWLPPERGATVESLGRQLGWLHPDIFPDHEASTAYVDAVGRFLAWLGAAGADGGLGLTGLGRWALRPEEPDPKQVAANFPSALETVVVGADARIIVAGPPSFDLAVTLARFADLEAAAPAHVYRLSEASLRVALDAGMTAEEVLHGLRERSRTELPQNIVALVEDVGRRHGRVRVGAAGFYVCSDDPVPIAQLVASRRLQGMRPRQLAPTVAVVEAPTLERVLEALRKEGLMPAADRAAQPGAPETSADPGRDRLAEPAPDPRPHEPAPPEPKAGLDARDAAALARRLRSLPDAEGAVSPRLTGPAVRLLLARAARDGLVLAIGHQRSPGSAPERVEVESLRVRGDLLQCWSRSARVPHSVPVGEVAWAEALPEAPRRSWAHLLDAVEGEDEDLDLLSGAFGDDGLGLGEDEELP